MAIIDLDGISQTLRQHQHQLPLLAAGLAYIGLTLVLRARSTTASQNSKIIFSPKKTLLPQLSEQEAADLPYPPDVLPGVRDVDSPYGSLRVYEWGPEDGRKVLMVHGISTPCISLGNFVSRRNYLGDALLIV